MPSLTEQQGRLAQLRRMNERQPVTYYVTALIKEKHDSECDLVHYETTDPRKRRLYQRFIRRAIKCRRFKVVKPL